MRSRPSSSSKNGNAIRVIAIFNAMRVKRGGAMTCPYTGFVGACMTASSLKCRSINQTLGCHFVNSADGNPLEPLAARRLGCRDNVRGVATGVGLWRAVYGPVHRAEILADGQADSNPGQYDLLIKADAAQQKARRYRASPAYFTTAWQRECKAPDGVVILTANQAAKRVAAMMVLIHGKGALYQVGWAGDEGRAVNAHNLLMWQ